MFQKGSDGQRSVQCPPACNPVPGWPLTVQVSVPALAPNPTFPKGERGKTKGSGDSAKVHIFQMLLPTRPATTGYGAKLLRRPSAPLVCGDGFANRRKDTLRAVRTARTPCSPCQSEPGRPGRPGPGPWNTTAGMHAGCRSPAPPNGVCPAPPGAAAVLPGSNPCATCAVSHPI